MAKTGFLVTRLISFNYFSVWVSFDLPFYDFFQLYYNIAWLRQGASPWDQHYIQSSDLSLTNIFIWVLQPVKIISLILTPSQ